jgi:TonB family protein
MGTGQQVGPLFFDPQGADFTAWVNHFKNDVYRNWVVPQSALFGYAGGQVSFAFTVERDGRVSRVEMTASSGTPAFDRAAHNALSSSRLLPLPADFGPSRLTIQVTFYYGEGPKRE